MRQLKGEESFPKSIFRTKEQRENEGNWERQSTMTELLRNLAMVGNTAEGLWGRRRRRIFISWKDDRESGISGRRGDEDNDEDDADSTMAFLKASTSLMPSGNRWWRTVPKLKSRINQFYQYMFEKDLGNILMAKSNYLELLFLNQTHLYTPWSWYLN